jgi:protocatechuate 3,4-dioxygenase beta subunit
MAAHRIALATLTAAAAVATTLLASPFEQGRGAAPLQPQRPMTPRDAPGGAGQELAVGKGSISGVVVVSGSGMPARRARVNLSATDAGRGRSTVTDDSGRFAFAQLPEGRYTVSASKPGHIAGTYGQRIPGRAGTPIQLGDGEQMRIQLQIWKGSVITGTVLDEQGEAIPNTPVRAFRYVFQGGQRVLQQSGSAQTDDRGVYRVFGLQPGDYLVSATPRPGILQSGAAVEEARVAVAAALERAAATGALPAQSQTALLDRVAAVSAAAGDAQPESGTGYAPVYYPGTTSPGNAAAITVAPGEEKSGIDFSYQVVPVARVEGIVASTTAQLPPNVQITLVNSGFNVPGLNPGGARADQSGAFRINNVPPGTYTVVARATISGPFSGRGGGRGVVPAPAGRGGPLQGRVEAVARGGPVEQTRLWGSTEITVDGRNVSNVLISLQPGVPVSGRIAFDGNAPQPTDLTRMRVNLQPVVAPGSAGDLSTNAAGRVEADGRFTIGSVVPGRYRLTASAAGEGWYLGSSTLDGQESLDFPVEIKGAVSGAIVTFVDRRAELTGVVTNEKSQPVSDYSLIIFPADARYRTPQSRRILSTRPATDGRYTFRNLPAGEYRIAPVLDPEPGSWFDPAFLQELENTSMRISIAEGEKNEQNLRVPGA